MSQIRNIAAKLYFLLFCVLLSHGKKQREIKNKKNIVFLPLRGLENCWLDFYLAVRYSRLHNVCVILMAPDYLPIGTFESSQGKKIIIKKYFLKCYLALITLLLKLKRIKVIIIGNKRVISNSAEFDQNSFLSYVRRYFGSRLYDFHERGDGIKEKFKQIYAMELPYRNQPVHIVSSHHIYEWGAIIENLERNSIVESKVCWGRSYFKDILLLSNAPLQIGLPIGNTYSLPSTYFKDRVEGKSLDQAWVTTSESPNELKDFFNGFDNKLLIAPNCIWDGDIPQKEGIFSGVEELVEKTIEISNYYPNTGVVVRFHPAEKSLWKDRPSLYELFKHTKIPRNVMFIPPESNWSTMVIARECDKVVIYSGMLAYECANENIPVYCVSNSVHSKAKGVAKLDNVNEFTKLFQGPAKKSPPQNISGLQLEKLISTGLRINKPSELMTFATIPSFGYIKRQKDIDEFFDKEFNLN